MSPSLPAVFPVLLIAALQWLTPSFTPPTVQFGVRIPGARETEPVIVRQRARFRLGVLLLTVPMTACALVTGRSPLAVSVVVLLQILGCTLLYLRARAAITTVKNEQDWYGGLRQVTVTDTTLRTSPERFPWPWALPSLVVPAVTVFVGAVRYPSLPDRLPTHFSTWGRPDAYASTSIGTAFALVAVQVVVTLLMVGLSALALRSRAQLDAEDPAAPTRHRRFVAAMARGLLVLGACSSVTFLFAALQTWLIIKPRGAWEVILLAGPPLVGALALILLSLRYGQGGTRLQLPTAPTGAPHSSTNAPPEAANTPDTPTGAADAPTAAADAPTGAADVPTAAPHVSTGASDVPTGASGVLAGARDVPAGTRTAAGKARLVNRDDPALFAPKRFGIGWTVNMARPLAWILLAMTILLIALAPILSH